MYKWLVNHRVKERKTQLRKKIANVNWPIVRDHLHEFISGFITENKEFLAQYHVEKTDTDCGGSGYWGFDSLQFYQNNRLTGTGEWLTENGQRSNVPHFDYGVTLDINHSNTGRIQVLLKRKQCEISSIKHPSIILFYTDDPLKITEKRILQFIEKTLFYSRATSIDRRLNLFEKFELFALEFRSVIRMKSVSSYLYELFAKTAYAAIMAAVAILTLYVSYLGYLSITGS